MSNTPEGRVKDKVRAMLKRHQIWYFLPGNNGMGSSGVPDFVCCVSGRFIGIECKADATKRPTPLQMACASKIEMAGGRWFLVYDEASLAEAEAVIVATKRCL